MKAVIVDRTPNSKSDAVRLLLKNNEDLQLPEQLFQEDPEPDLISLLLQCLLEQRTNPIHIEMSFSCHSEKRIDNFSFLAPF